MEARSFLTPVSAEIPGEVFETLLETAAFRLERIVSRGHATPPGEWLDQDTAEWVVLLNGAARLAFEGRAAPVVLRPGEYVLIPPHRRHRVEETDPREPTVWLAIHYRP
ncbi:MAG TPA: cupin domain-containing protein [Candidatus Binatia bacterium]|nr:cupin domain-containing protein [Candidatus Binatia bacterium]